MESMLNLEELGARLATVDRTILALIQHRMELSAQVGRFKRKTGQPIFRADIEDRRIAEIAEYAGKRGLNQHFARGLLYDIINESCKLQMIQLQSEETGKEPATEEEWYDSLKEGLLALTERTCRTYDAAYDRDFFATRSYTTYEFELLASEVAKTVDRGLAVDLGCATGRTTFKLATDFEQVIGYDLSQHMTATAEEKLEALGLSNVSFQTHDVESSGIPLADGSVSFVVMNLGTASDVRDFTRVWDEIMRVLKPGGRFLLSFYNAEALVYRWALLPWPTGLAAHVSVHRHCLEVVVEGETFSVYARPYRESEVRKLLRRSAVDLDFRTYPTVSAVLPNELFSNQPDIQAAIEIVDRGRAHDRLGAYLITVGAKRQ